MAEGLLEAGCKVVIIDVQKEKVEKVCEEYRAKGLEAYSVIGNLADRADLNRAFDEALQILDGRLDVLVPAAGIQRRYLPEEFPAEQWDLVMKINLDHVWFMIQRSLQVMLKQPTGGKIITIGSMASYFGCTTVPAYTATKGAVAQLTKSVAVDCAGRGININCICPGYMDTEMCANMEKRRRFIQHDAGAQGRVHQAHPRWPLGPARGYEGSRRFPGFRCIRLPERCPDPR